MAKMARETVAVRNCPNAAFRWFETSVQINQGEERTFVRPARGIRGIPYVESVGEVGNQIAKGILKITGVVQVAVAPYKITAEKLPNYRWESLEPRILKAIQACIPEDSQATELGQEVVNTIS